MKIRYGSQICFLVLAISFVQGQDLNTPESRITADLTVPTLIRKLLEKKIDLPKNTATDVRASKSLAIQIKDKKVRSPNLDLPLGRDNVNEYSTQHDPDGNGEVMVSAIALRYIIIAPVVCRKGYQKDSLGKCRRLL